jgi:hypothetical protein
VARDVLDVKGDTSSRSNIPKEFPQVFMGPWNPHGWPEKQEPRSINNPFAVKLDSGLGKDSPSDRRLVQPRRRHHQSKNFSTI